jgi:hypothetical protein
MENGKTALIAFAAKKVSSLFFGDEGNHLKSEKNLDGASSLKASVNQRSWTVLTPSTFAIFEHSNSHPLHYAHEH